MSRTQKLTPPVIFKPCGFIANGMCTSMKANRELTYEEIDFIERRFKKFAKKCNGKINIIRKSEL